VAPGHDTSALSPWQPDEKNIEDDPRAMRRLRTEVEKAKRSLSNSSAVVVEIESFWQDETLKAEITKAKFEELCSSLFQKCMDVVKNVMKDAKVTKTDVDEVVLVREPCLCSLSF
jgi:molecular chaperone DnaK (HSP70)